MHKIYTCKYFAIWSKYTQVSKSIFNLRSHANRHFSVTPYITICPSTETYFGLYLRGAMSAVTGTYLFRLLLNIIFLVLRSFFNLNKQYIL